MEVSIIEHVLERARLTGTHHCAHLDWFRALAAHTKQLRIAPHTLIEGRWTSHTAAYWYRHFDDN
jgi:hypothetical protein